MAFIPYGITPPIITPFNEDGTVNYELLGKLAVYLVKQGVHGLFPLGTSGEFYAVDDDEFRKILMTVRDAVKNLKNQDGKPVQLFAGCQHITTRGVIRKIHIVEEIGGYDAVTVLTPMFVSQTDEEIYQFYKTIADSTDMPIIMYNNRGKTNVTIAPEVTARLAHDCRNIVAVKDSTGDMTNLEEYLRLTKDMRDHFNVLVGKDTMIFAGLMYGASGAVASCANVAPALVADIYEKWKKKDYAGALKAQYDLAPLRIACNKSTFPEAIKEGLMLEGWHVNKCLDPIQKMTGSQHEELKEVLQTMKLI